MMETEEDSKEVSVGEFDSTFPSWRVRKYCLNLINQIKVQTFL